MALFVKFYLLSNNDKWMIKEVIIMISGECANLVVDTFNESKSKNL